MAREQHTFDVETSHKRMAGDRQTFRIHVYCEGDSGWFCDNAGLGCSRTFKVDCPVEAISHWLREHDLCLLDCQCA